MRWAKDSIIRDRHQLLRDFIVKHLQAAQAKADSIRERASRAIERWNTDPLCKLIAAEYTSKCGYFEPPEVRIIQDADETVAQWQRVLDECDANPHITPDDALEPIWHDTHRYGPTLEGACWGALGECGRCSTAELVGLSGYDLPRYDLPGGPLRKEDQ